MENSRLDLSTDSEKLQKWIRDYAHEALECGHVSRHFDELGLSAQAGPLQMVRELFSVAYSEVVNLEVPLIVCLVIPCSPFSTLSALFDVGVEEFVGNLPPCEEPPSVHLINLQTFLHPEKYEEYIWPMSNFVIPAVAEEEYKIYFRFFRNPEAIRNGWEYSGGLYFESAFPGTPV